MDGRLGGRAQASLFVAVAAVCSPVGALGSLRTQVFNLASNCSFSVSVGLLGVMPWAPKLVGEVYSRPEPTGDEVFVFAVWLVVCRALFHVCVARQAIPSAMGGVGWRAGVGCSGGAHADCAPTAAVSHSRSGIAFLGVAVRASICNLLMLDGLFNIFPACFLVSRRWPVGGNIGHQRCTS